MRIALLTHAFPPHGLSGIGRYVEDLAGGLARLGHEVVVFAVYKNEQEISENRSGYRIEWLPDVGNSSSLPFWRLLRLTFRLNSKLKELHRNHAFDVIEAPNTWAPALAVFWGELRRHTLRVTRLSTPRAWFEQRVPWLPRLTEWLEYLQVAASDLVISNTRENLELSRRLYPIQNKITHVVYHGIPDPGPPSIIHNQRPPSILFIGRMEPRKGFDVLAEAWPRVLDAFPTAVLHAVGEDLPGPLDEASFFEWATRGLTKKQQSQIRYHGKVDDDHRNQLLSSADIVVVPSRYESFGLVILEAMAREKPVVASAAGGMVEIVEDGITGLLVQPEAPGELGDAIVSLLSDDSRCCSMGKKARERMLAHFTVERMTRASLASYRKAIDGAGTKT